MSIIFRIFKGWWVGENTIVIGREENPGSLLFLFLFDHREKWSMRSWEGADVVGKLGELPYQT